jgi:RND family efflux transporter MFP subunit
MISVPEGAAAQLRPGAVAEVLVRGVEASVPGRVVRTAGALDPSTRTMLAEVDVPNTSGVLLPGMYAQVRLAVRSVTPGVLLPANALVVRSAGPQVALVRDGRVHFVKVVLGRDLGTDVEVLSGLDDGATVVMNPSDEVTDGAPVRVAAARAKDE